MLLPVSRSINSAPLFSARSLARCAQMPVKPGTQSRSSWKPNTSRSKAAGTSSISHSLWSRYALSMGVMGICPKPRPAARAGRAAVGRRGTSQHNTQHRWQRGERARVFRSSMISQWWCSSSNARSSWHLRRRSAIHRRKIIVLTMMAAASGHSPTWGVIDAPLAKNVVSSPTQPARYRGGFR